MRATSSKTVRCKDVFVPAHRVVSMYCREAGGHAWPGLESPPQPALPHSDLRDRRQRHRRLPRRQRARGARDDDRMGEVAQHQLHRREDARLPDRAAAHRRGRARRSTPRALLMRNDCSKRSASTTKAARSISRRGCATSATARWRVKLASKPSIRCTRWPAANGIYDTLPAPAHLPRHARAAPGTSASASTRSCRRGGSSRWAASSRARRCKPRQPAAARAARVGDAPRPLERRSAADFRMLRVLVQRLNRKAPARAGDAERADDSCPRNRTPALRRIAIRR